MHNEDLHALARFSFENADTFCNSENGCNPYHKTWSFLRLFERGSVLPAGEAFYRQELEGVVARGARRILLSGAADTGLIALVSKVFAELGMRPEITLVDRCRTVIEQNRLFVEASKSDAEFFVGSIHDFYAEPFDVIFAHSFMLFFPGDQLDALALTWRRLLKDDGIVLSTDFMTSSADPVQLSAMTQEEIEAKLAVVTKAAEDYGMDRSAIAELNRCSQFVLKEMHLISQTPLLSLSELRNRMRSGGLEVLRTSSGANPRLTYSTQGTNYFYYSTVIGAL